SEPTITQRTQGSKPTNRPEGSECHSVQTGQRNESARKGRRHTAPPAKPCARRRTIPLRRNALLTTSHAPLPWQRRLRRPRQQSPTTTSKRPATLSLTAVKWQPPSLEVKPRYRQKPA